MSAPILTGRSAFARFLMIVSLLCAAAALAFSLYFLGVTLAARYLPAEHVATARQCLSYGIRSLLVILPLYPVLALLFLVWLYQRVNERQCSVSSGLSTEMRKARLLWFFAPVFNLWQPYRLLRDLARNCASASAAPAMFGLYAWQAGFVLFCLFAVPGLLELLTILLPRAAADIATFFILLLYRWPEFFAFGLGGGLRLMLACLSTAALCAGTLLAIRTVERLRQNALCAIAGTPAAPCEGTNKG